MKIAIVGGGVSGRALYRLLELDGSHDVDIYGLKHSTKCGISPCGWCVCTGEFCDVNKNMKLHAETIINTYHELQVGDDMNIRCDLSTFDKPEFLNQMCPDSVIDDPDHRMHGEHDIIVDATGTARALLPPINNDMTLPCMQERYEVKNDSPLAIIPSAAVGYAWLFPICDNSVHIGQGWAKCDATRSEEIQQLKAMMGVTEDIPQCSCKSEIRLLTPKYCKPITDGNIVGVGESVGTVSPMCGAGIIPAIKSAMLLASNINDLQRYEQTLISDFSFLDREVDIVRKLESGRILDMLDVAVLYRNCRVFGLFPGWSVIVNLMKMLGGRII